MENSDSVKLSRVDVPYLSEEIIKTHSKLRFYDKTKNEILLNMTILQALNCNFLQDLNYEEEEIAISTADFSIAEIQELQRFYFTGNCNLAIASSFLDALGIDLTQFCLQSQIKVEVKSEPKEPKFDIDEDDVDLDEVEDFISDDPGSEEEEESDEDWNKSGKNLGSKTKTRGNILISDLFTLSAFCLHKVLRNSKSQKFLKKFVKVCLHST